MQTKTKKPPANLKKFAAGTEVSPQRSREELDRLLRKYGAVGFGYVDHAEAVAIAFQIDGRSYRFVVEMPQIENFKKSAAGNLQSSQKQKSDFDQATRERWRALVATIKGKLISIETGIESFEEVFMRNVIMPNGQTVAEYLEPQLEAMYESGKMPKMLPGA